MLQTKNLLVSISDKKILDSVNLICKESEVTLLLGKNGAGKSTLVRAVMGDPMYDVGGEILFEEKPVSEMPISERAKKGIFLQFQNPPEIEGVRFLKFLKIAFEELTNDKFSSLSEFKKYCARELEKFDLPSNFLDRNLNEGFSGGEKKLGEFIQMVILKPKFCMLDEPDSGLDIDARKKLVRLIKKMQSDLGTTFLVISHYPEFGRLLNPVRVFVLKDGQNFIDGGKEIISKVEIEGFEKSP